MPVLEVLVCTYGDRIAKLGPVIRHRSANLRYLVCHQLPDGPVPPPANVSDRSDVRYLAFSDRGLSRNRNHALENMNGDIILLADDDVEYPANFVDTILDCFNTKLFDFLTFGSTDSLGRPSRHYPRREIIHDTKSVYQCASIEIAFQRAAVAKSAVRFNENFGIGSRFLLGEEAIFLHGLLLAGLKGAYVPRTIVSHPPSSTGTQFWDKVTAESIRAVGAICGHKWGRLAPLLAIKELVRLNDRRRLAGLDTLEYVASYAEGLVAGMSERRST